MMRTVLFRVAVTIFCWAEVPSTRLPAGSLQKNAPTENPPDSCPVTKPPQPRFCRPRPIRLTVGFGLARRNCGIICQRMGRGEAYRTTLQRTVAFARSFSGGARATICALRIDRNSRLPESDWTDRLLSCPQTPSTQIMDGPMTATIPSWLSEFLFPLLGAGKSPDITRANS